MNAPDRVSPRRRLLFVINDLPYFLSHRLPVAQAAREAGYEVHVAGPSGPGLADHDVRQFRFHDLPIHRSRMVLREELRIVLRIREIYRSVKPDLIHLITLKPVLYGGILVRLMRGPRTLFALTGLGVSFSGSGLLAALRRRVASQALKFALGHPLSRTIMQNPEDIRELTEAGVVSAAKCVLIRGSGVNLDVFRPAPEPDGIPLVVLASRLLWQKGVGEFVEAARRLKKAGHSLRFALVGAADPSNPSAIPVSTMEQWHAEGVIEWWRHRADMPQVFAQSSIVCLPTYYREGVPKVLLEAAASGRPIVTTDWPGCREIVRHGDNGLLVPIRDAGAVAEALLKLLGDRSLRRQMGERGRDIAVREFGEQSVVASTLAAYDEVLSLGVRPASEAGSEIRAPLPLAVTKRVFAQAPKLEN